MDSVDKGIRRNSHAVWNHKAPPTRHGQNHHPSAMIENNVLQKFRNLEMIRGAYIVLIHGIMELNIFCNTYVNKFDNGFEKIFLTFCEEGYSGFT